MNFWLYCSFIFLFSMRNISKGQKTARKCGLPSDILVLPDFAQDEIRAVWKDYKTGNKCEKEQLITEDILTVLEMFDKEFDKHTTVGGERRAGEPPITSQPGNISPVPSAPVQVAPSAAVAVDTDYNDLGLFAHTKHSSSASRISSSQKAAAVQLAPDVPTPATGRSPSSGASTTSSITQTQPYDRPARINLNKYVHDYDYITGGTTHKNNEGPARNDYEEYDAETSQTTTSSRPKKPLQQAHFYEPSERLPFLRGAQPDVLAAFQQVLDDPDIPSERRRQEEIHLLAVSFLNSRQLSAFNTWSTERRKRLKAREQQLHHLSRRARNALKRLALADGGSPEQRQQAHNLPVNIQQELRSFARRRLRDRLQSNSSS